MVSICTKENNENNRGESVPVYYLYPTSPLCATSALCPQKKIFMSVQKTVPKQDRVTE